MSHDEGRSCLCSANHQPYPLEFERHHIWPLGMGGPDVEGNIVWICPTTHTNVHELLKILLKRGPVGFYVIGEMYDVPVNRYTYSLARVGYSRFKAGSTL